MTMTVRTTQLTGLVLLLALGACATPQQQCIAKATVELRSLQSQIRTTEATIARGYAIHKQSVPYRNPQICYDRQKKPYVCSHTRFHRIEVPVTVNIGAEKAKLAALKAQLSTAQTKAAKGTQACRQTYRE